MSSSRGDDLSLLISSFGMGPAMVEIAASLRKRIEFAILVTAGQPGWLEPPYVLDHSQQGETSGIFWEFEIRTSKGLSAGLMTLENCELPGSLVSGLEFLIRKGVRFCRAEGPSESSAKSNDPLRAGEAERPGLEIPRWN